ncbi:Leukocyte receptor cluster (LRC) member 8 [Perkinsus olseni]|uniref:Leukocyte receptor cluster (LRC) member 8 n=1 Tax=Perkinsus olseni TaxID=32597 RepID=A0A7J6N6W6_PEROL|nr:Leukocyte receptor cluster (LRC) member 8 [Perkinsus olseni]
MPRQKFGQRVTVYSSGGSGRLPQVDAEERKRRAGRAARFRQIDPATDTRTVEADDAGEIPTPEKYVKGTCRHLEKEYLRLTGPAKAEFVRPPSVLTAAFDRLQEIHHERSWEYVSGQLRAIRQDMKVQGLDGSELSLSVYTTNARWALDSHDLVQFIQCLSAVTRQIHVGSTVLSEDVRAEFLAYEIVYCALQNFHADQLRFLRRLNSMPEGIRRHKFIRSALRVRSWAAVGNYFRILKVYGCLCERPRQFGSMVPSHMLALLELFVGDLRLRFLRCLTKAYMQLRVPVVTRWLRFCTDDDCRSFLSEHSTPHEGDVIVCKACFPIIQKQVEVMERRRVG